MKFLIGTLIALITMTFLKIIGHGSTELEFALIGFCSYFLSSYIICRIEKNK